MHRYLDGTCKINAPNKVEFEGFIRDFADLTREQQDSIGYNEAIPIKREPFTTYETEWAKGDDLIYREEVISAVVDESAKTEAEASKVRSERDQRIADLQWRVERYQSEVRLGISPTDRIEDLDAVAQALRDVPQQKGFPWVVDWPAG